MNLLQHAVASLPAWGAALAQLWLLFYGAATLAATVTSHWSDERLADVSKVSPRLGWALKGAKHFGSDVWPALKALVNMGVGASHLLPLLPVLLFAVGAASCSGTRITVGGTGGVTQTAGGDTTWAVGVQIGIQLARRELPQVQRIVDAHAEIPADTRATVDRVMVVTYDSLGLAQTAIDAYLAHPDPAGRCAAYGYVEAAFTGALQGLNLAQDAGAPIPPEVAGVVGGLGSLVDVLFPGCGQDAGAHVGGLERATARRVRR